MLTSFKIHTINYDPDKNTTTFQGYFYEGAFQDVVVDGVKKNEYRHLKLLRTKDFSLSEQVSEVKTVALLKTELATDTTRTPINSQKI